VVEVERMMAIVVVGYLKTTNGIIHNGKTSLVFISNFWKYFFFFFFF
jgi:hypothetical protein